MSSRKRRWLDEPVGGRIVCGEVTVGVQVSHIRPEGVKMGHLSIVVGSLLHRIECLEWPTKEKARIILGGLLLAEFKKMGAMAVTAGEINREMDRIFESAQ